MMLVDTEPQHMQALRIANDRRVAAGAIRRELTAGTITIGRALEDERSGSLRAIAIVMTQPRIGRDRAAAILRWQRIPEDTMVRRLTHRRRALIAAAFGDVYDPSVAPSVEPPLGSDRAASPSATATTEGHLNMATKNPYDAAHHRTNCSEDRMPTDGLREFLANAKVPCGHPPDPVAFVKPDGGAICHCGCMLDRSRALDRVPPDAPGPIVPCSKCGCYVAVPSRPSATPAPTDGPRGLKPQHPAGMV